MNFEATIGTSVTNLIQIFEQIPFLSKLSVDELLVTKSDSVTILHKHSSSKCER
jgi:hypothetical protein